MVIATPRPLYPREIPGTHCIGGWVGPRAGLCMCVCVCVYIYIYIYTHTYSKPKHAQLSRQMSIFFILCHPVLITFIAYVFIAFYQHLL
jgi:hypothetical protein